ncbi:PREDICTED: uncharacterized protein LOC109592475 [Amphimedon queenslandica]|uniref:Uncharacterized protein n=2 Tax=Amphimedon queenslandica TaxID=400682 RepID=A0AAN0K1R4_AMPQE|nr:PREDICTED: uncharacterized protein LOC109592475 [Amphimedon queenslandica]|eukprot:XP_019863469.1 PREDICTED: uncharacterized protein LOC109592475 [Amphimedon queenslandica]
MVTSNALSIIFELEFSTSVEDAYTYTLHQRDYCKNQLNSSEINNTLISEINDTIVLINIQSLMYDETWSVSVEVAVCQYNDTTQYINITNGSDTDKILDCRSDPLMSSTATVSLTLSSSISSMEHASFFVSPSSSSSSSVTNTPSGTPVSGKSINITTVIGGVTGGVVTLILILIVAVLIACKLKKRGSFNPTSEGENEGNDGRETFELEINDTADDGEAPTDNTSASIDDMEPTDVSNEGYERQTHLVS